MNSGPLRAALVGTGMISLYHLRAWQAAGVPVVALCDLDRDRAEARAAEFGIERVHTDPQALFADGGFELVDIAASVQAHDPVSRMAADHGVHVMLQKPMTETVAEAEALIGYVADRVRFMIHENYRFRPHYMQVRRWIDEGRIGTVRHIGISCRGSGLCAREGAEPFLVERQPYLKGFRRNLVFETMIHHLDVLRCIAGPLTVVAARLNRLADGLPGEGHGVDPHGGARWPDRDGGRLHLRTRLSAAARRPAGSGGHASDDHHGLQQGLDRPDRTRPRSRLTCWGRYQECFDTAIAAFVAGVRDGTPFETDARDNLETLRLMESVYRSAGVEVSP